MTGKVERAGLLVLLVLSVVATLLLHPSRSFARTPSATASDCKAEVDAIDGKIQEFDKQVKKDATGFLIDGAASAALADARKVLQNRTSPPAARVAAHAAYQEWIDSFEQISATFGVTLEDLERCLMTSGCSMADFAKRQSQAFQKWMESYLSGSTQTALERVRAVRSMLDGYVKQLGGTAAGSAAAAVQCMKEYELAQVSNAGVVDASATPRGRMAAPAAKKRGANVGAIALVSAGIVGGGLALGYALKEAEGSDVSAVTSIAFSGGVGGFGSFFSIRITPALDRIPITCTWRGNSGRQVTRSTVTSPGGTASCANSDVSSWPDATLFLSAIVTGRPELTTGTRVY